MPSTRQAYLDRLGLEAEPPSVEALRRLHRAQVERVPYETMWIHAGERWGIDPSTPPDRVAHEGRGGYCFHLNGAFSELLRVARLRRAPRHVGGVHGPAGPSADELTNHLVLTVAGLPTEANPPARGTSMPGSATPCTSRCRSRRRVRAGSVPARARRDAGRRRRLAPHPRPGRELRRDELASGARWHGRCSPSGTRGCRRRPTPTSCGSPPCSDATPPASTSCAASCCRAPGRAPVRRRPHRPRRLVRGAGRGVRVAFRARVPGPARRPVERAASPSTRPGKPRPANA